MQHPDEGTIHAWLDGALAGDEADAVAKHVNECRDCAALVAEARGMIAAAANIVSALDVVRGGVIPAPAAGQSSAGGQRSLWRRLHLTPARAALAATLMIAVASLLSVGRSPRAMDQLNRGSATRPSVDIPTTAAPRSPEPQRVEMAASAAKAAAPVRPSGTSIATSERSGAAAALERSKNALVPKTLQKTADAPQPAVDSTRAGLAEARTIDAARRAPAARVSEVVTTAAGAGRFKSFDQTGDLEGCYEIRSDSAASAFATGILRRFALTRDTSATTEQNAVRSITPEGHVDSIVPGGSWRKLAPNVTQVSFASARDRRLLMLQLTGGVLTGRAGVGDQTTNVPVARIECRP